MLHERSLLSALLTCLVLSAAAPLACGEDNSPVPEATDITGPTRLSETGLYADFASRTLAPGIIRFAPAHPLWADGAEKSRYLLLPAGTRIDTRDMDRWVFPVGTKVWKEFKVDGKVVETRLLWRRRSEPGIDSWWHVAYVWAADGSDAIANVDGAPSALGTTHDVPSQDDCKYCHMHVRDAVIGFSAMELSSPGLTISQGGANGDVPTGLLLPLARQGVFTDPPTADLVVPGTGIVRDALAYLHGNCGFCHNEQMNQLIKRTIRFRLMSTDATPEQTGAYTTTFHTKMFHTMEDGVDEAIVPGEPDKSQAYRRMTATDLTRMPPKGTNVVDAAGGALIRDWILGLPR
jgi:hypothetical protein